MMPLRLCEDERSVRGANEAKETAFCGPSSRNVSVGTTAEEWAVVPVEGVGAGEYQSRPEVRGIQSVSSGM